MKSLRWGGVILCFDLNNTKESKLQLFSFIEEGLRGLIRSWNGLPFWGKCGHQMCFILWPATGDILPILPGICNLCFVMDISKLNTSWQSLQSVQISG